MTWIDVVACVLVFGVLPVALFVYGLCRAAAKDNWRDEL